MLKVGFNRKHKLHGGYHYHFHTLNCLLAATSDSAQNLSVDYLELFVSFYNNLSVKLLSDNLAK